MSPHQGVEGKSVVLSAHILDLPLELVHLITQYLSKGDLKNLSLVNHEYQQMTRPILFEAVLIDYSIKSSYFLQTLCYDASDRSRSSSASSIRSSIRRLIVATNPSWLGRRQNITIFDLKNRKMSYSQFIAASRGRPEDWWRKLEYAKSAYFDLHLTSIELAISSKLPNLQLLDWKDGTVMTRSLLTTIACSPIQHLRLLQVVFDEEFEVELPSSLERIAWPLRSLHLEPTWETTWSCGSDTDKPSRSLCRMVNSIFRLCAPSLETLKWVGNSRRDKDRYSLACEREKLHFPELRRLTIEDINFADSSFLESILGPEAKVRELEMDIKHSSTEKDFFSRRGNIRTLRTLCCLSMGCFRFLQANPQLHRLRIERAVEASVLEHEVLPLLAQFFEQLSSLSLVWAEAYISKNAFAQISTLQSLRQLHLSAGRHTGLQHDWYVDHDEIRLLLRTLKNLRYLALSCDTYGDRSGYPDYYWSNRVVLQSMGELAIWSNVMALPNNAFIKRSNPFSSNNDHPSNEDEYYSYGDDTTQVRKAIAFDKIHKMRMTNEAVKYTRAFPKLQWIYIGKLQFAIKELRGERQAFCLSEELDNCSSLLRQMFGLPNSEDCRDFGIFPP